MAYGNLAICLGVVILGNYIAFIGGIISHHGELTITSVIISATIGAMLYNHMLFTVGTFIRKRKRTINRRNYKYIKKLKSVNYYFAKSPFLVILLFRFVPGMRYVVPATIGVLNYSRIKFIIFDLIGSLFYSLIAVFLGYTFGNLVEKVILGTKKYDLYIGLGVLVIFIIYQICKKLTFKQKDIISEIENLASQHEKWH